jgi:hypothetical protein
MKNAYLRNVARNIKRRGAIAKSVQRVDGEFTTNVKTSGFNNYGSPKYRSIFT